MTMGTAAHASSSRERRAEDRRVSPSAVDLMPAGAADIVQDAIFDSGASAAVDCIPHVGSASMPGDVAESCG
jgi:hypothetical protein